MSTFMKVITALGLIGTFITGPLAAFGYLPALFIPTVMAFPCVLGLSMGEDIGKHLGIGNDGKGAS